MMNKMKSEKEIKEEYIKLLNSKTENMYVMDAAVVVGMIKGLRWVLDEK